MSKWIEVGPWEVLRTAARVTLADRFQSLRESLEPALEHAADDPEFVHDLRVASRRMTAALDIFRPCLPRKAAKRIDKSLKRIRKAAGAARDCDVFALKLQTQLDAVDAHDRPGLEYLLDRTRHDRADAQERLVKAGERLDRDDFLARCADLLDRLEQPAGGRRQACEQVPLIEKAEVVLDQRHRELVAAVPGDFDDWDGLHQLRIAAKKLRYSMEVFGGCYPESFRTQLYPPVEQVQDILGEVHDNHVAIGDLSKTLEDLADHKRFTTLRPGIEGMIDLCRRGRSAWRQAFLTLWSDLDQREFRRMLEALPTPPVLGRTSTDG